MSLAKAFLAAMNDNGFGIPSLGTKNFVLLQSKNLNPPFVDGLAKISFCCGNSTRPTGDSFRKHHVSRLLRRCVYSISYEGIYALIHFNWDQELEE